MVVAGLALLICGWALIYLLSLALIGWVLGAAFSYAGERRTARRGLPHLRLARAVIVISTLPVVIFTRIPIVANRA